METKYCSGKPHCTCGCVLSYDDCVDSYDNIDTIDYVVVGSCPKCGKTYVWEDRYQRIGYAYLREAD